MGTTSRRCRSLLIGVSGTYTSCMSTADILNELPKLPLSERREIARRLAELDRGMIDLQGRGIDARTAAELRSRLSQFAEDWDSPEMTAYDDYDAAKPAM